MAANSSDSESEFSSQIQPVQEKRKHTKYLCPADFVVCDFSPCASTRLESANDDNTELWLIKAPVTFSPDSFSGIRLPTMGLETVRPRATPQQVYSVLSRPVAAGDSRLLTTSGQRSGDALCAPAFSGIINICESYGGCQGNQALVPIPACPAPLVPEGLKQRFRPFGSRTLSGQGTQERGPWEEGPADGPTAAKRIKVDPEDCEAPKKKKKRKKDKRVKEETVEGEVSAAVSHALTEPSQEPASGEEVVVEKKKKKKKSKDRDRGEMGLRLKEEVKDEPMDIACSEMENLVKKKKMKKEKKEKQNL